MTPSAPCPYLPGRIERKVFTELKGREAQSLNDALTQVGFRRSQNVAYRPACDDCSACVSVRVRVDEFACAKSQKRTFKRNRDIVFNEAEPIATEEQFLLLKRYLRHRHPGGGMADMNSLDFSAMVESSPIDSRIVEYRLANENEPLDEARLVGACLTDVLSDGLSLVYSFFDPDFEERSLGSYVVLTHIEMARKLGLPYAYLGYWIADCRKMAYKTAFKPLDQLTSSGWKPLAL